MSRTRDISQQNRYRHFVSDYEMKNKWKHFLQTPAVFDFLCTHKNFRSQAVEHQGEVTKPSHLENLMLKYERLNVV